MNPDVLAQMLCPRHPAALSCPCSRLSTLQKAGNQMDLGPGAFLSLGKGVCDVLPQPYAVGVVAAQWLWNQGRFCIGASAPRWLRLPLEVLLSCRASSHNWEIHSGIQGHSRGVSKILLYPPTALRFVVTKSMFASVNASGMCKSRRSFLFLSGPAYHRCNPGVGNETGLNTCGRRWSGTSSVCYRGLLSLRGTPWYPCM